MRDLRINRFYKKIYQSYKDKALSYEASKSAGHMEYQTNHEQLSKRGFKISNEQELVRAIEAAQIVFLGDFHTFDQSTKNLERILKVLLNTPQVLVLGMELIHKKHQKHIDHFISGSITEMELLESIEYCESWKFPWNHYRILFEFAKNNKIKILALNSEGSLIQRDHQASEVLYSFIQKNPFSKILVLFGELHIVPNKLPSILTSLFIKKAPKKLILHQNLDEAYWKLQKMNSDAQIIKFNKEEFSLQTSPPWIKYESMIYWYEHLVEDPDFDIHEYVIETGSKLFSDEVDDNFLFLINQILNSLNLKYPSALFSEFNLYDHDNINYVIEILNTIRPKTVTDFYKTLILKGDLFKIPGRSDYYCSSYSINRLAYLAGTHIFNIIRLEKQKESIYKKLNSSRFLRFGHFLGQSILSYLSSKIINPYRKCALYQDFIKMSDSEPVYQLCLDLIEKPESLRQILNACENLPLIQGKGQKKYADHTIHKLAKDLGHFYGEILYLKLNLRQIKDFNKIVDRILSRKFTPKEFLNINQKILDGVDYKKTKKRFF